MMYRILLVVRFHAPDVSRGIHQPGQVQRKRVSKDGGIPRVHRFLIPEMAWDPGRQQEAEKWHQNNIQSVKYKNIR